MNKTQSLFGLLLATCLFTSSVLAELPGWYPKNFDMIGTVDRVTRNSIFIHDRRFVLSPTVKFTTISNSNASIGQLKLKQLVGVDIITINNRRIIDRIWLIPKSEHSKYRPGR